MDDFEIKWLNLCRELGVIDASVLNTHMSGEQVNEEQINAMVAVRHKMCELIKNTDADWKTIYDMVCSTGELKNDVYIKEFLNKKFSLAFFPYCKVAKFYDVDIYDIKKDDKLWKECQKVHDVMIKLDALRYLVLCSSIMEYDSRKMNEVSRMFKDVCKLCDCDKINRSLVISLFKDCGVDFWNNLYAVCKLGLDNGDYSFSFITKDEHIKRIIADACA